MQADAENHPPTILQGSKNPVFVGGGQDDLVCTNCGGNLALNINLRALISLDIKCSRCGKKTRTPSWADCESLPFAVITMGFSGVFRIDGPILLDERIALASGQEINRINQYTKCGPSDATPFDINLDTIKNLIHELNVYTNGDFKNKLQKARNAVAAGNKYFMQYPLAWAIVHLQDRLNGNYATFHESDRASISYLQQYYEAVKRWNHHPLFPSLIKAVSSEFHHFVTTLITAAYLHEAGNNIGFTDTQTAIGRSPDLYANLVLNDRLSIEVKSPSALYWPRKDLSENEISHAILRALKSASKGQITGSTGIVVVSASTMDPAFLHVFEREIEKILQRGKVSRSLQAIACVVHLSTGFPSGIQRITTNSHFSLHTNPRFQGDFTVSATQ